MIRNLHLKNRSVASLCAVLVGMLSVSACKKEQPPTPAAAPPQSVKAEPALPKPIQKPVSSSLGVIPPVVNQLDFSKKKDPFKPFVTAKASPAGNSDTAKKTLKNSLPIHSFDVNQFKLIGIITGGRESQAMVTDPGGKGYVLKVGMAIGKNGGKVASITTRGVDVLEQFRDENNRVHKEIIKLTLPRKQ